MCCGVGGSELRPVHAHMGQRAGKHDMQAGVRLYHQRHHAQAVSKWTKALDRLRTAEDRFITLGYLAQAYCDAADSGTMLHYAQLQMELATDRADEYMKSEAFLNLAKAYERLADFSKALTYGKASLQHPSMDPRTPGYAHLAMALASLGCSNFRQSLEAFEQAMGVANDTGDQLLELQICVGLGALFTLIRDLSKALIFLRNALGIVNGVTVEDVKAKYRASVLYHLSVALRLRGSLVEAKEACDEALQLASEIGNRSLNARCMCSLADIYRDLGESEAKETLTKSWARYEEAFRIMRAAEDRIGEAVVLASMAEAASESRSHYSGQCECQAIQLNKKCLEIAKMIGCKHMMLSCHSRLAELYAQLHDEDSEEAARKAASALTQEMELFCNFCGQRFADRDESLQALRCSHIFHEKCLHTFLLARADQTCPKCSCRAILSDNISMRTPSICSQYIGGPMGASTYGAAGSSHQMPPPPPTIDEPCSSNQVDVSSMGVAPPPIGGVRTAIVGCEEEMQQRRVRMAEGEEKGRRKPPPPPRRPCCSVERPRLPPPTALSEDGPLVVSRAPTITDV